LWTPLSGHGFIDSPHGKFEVEPGVCLLLRGGEEYHLVQDRRKRFVHFWVHFDYVDPAGQVIPHPSLSLPPLYRRLEDALLVNQILERLVTEFWTSGGDRTRSDRWLNAVLLEVARHDAAAAHSPRQTEVALWIRSRCAQIQSDPGKDHRVEQLAAELGYEVTYFCRLFRSHTGLSPREYITSARMRAARFLLRDSAVSIGEIATRVGYADVHFFSRHFRQHTGMSPSAYRGGRVDGKSHAK
jgi:AraC-like DNA-binding protein